MTNPPTSYTTSWDTTHHAVFGDSTDTQEGGPVPPQRPSLRQENRSPQLFCKRLY